MQNIVIRLLLFSTLVLAGCSKTDSYLGMLGKVRRRSNTYTGVFQNNFRPFALYSLVDGAVNQIEADGRTILGKTVQKGDIGLIKCLIDQYNADVNTVDGKGYTAMDYAIHNIHNMALEIINLLREKGATVVHLDKPGPDGMTALHRAVLYGRLDMVQYLVEEGACIEAQGNLFPFSAPTPLILAIKYGHVDIVQYLIKKGANVEVLYVDEDGVSHTILSFAVMRGHTVIFKYLYEFLYSGEQKAEKAVRYRYTTAMFKYLYSLYVYYLTQPNEAKDSAIQHGLFLLAAKHGHTAVIKYLMEQQDNTKFVINEGTKKQALRLAAEYRHLDTVQFLTQLLL